jgi:hypothetical protein
MENTYEPLLRALNSRGEELLCEHTAAEQVESGVQFTYTRKLDGKVYRYTLSQEIVEPALSCAVSDPSWTLEGDEHQARRKEKQRHDRERNESAGSEPALSLRWHRVWHDPRNSWEPAQNPLRC